MWRCVIKWTVPDIHRDTVPLFSRVMQSKTGTNHRSQQHIPTAINPQTNCNIQHKNHNFTSSNKCRTSETSGCAISTWSNSTTAFGNFVSCSVNRPKLQPGRGPIRFPFWSTQTWCYIQHEHGKLQYYPCNTQTLLLCPCSVIHVCVKHTD